jgi:hypothetical protein
MHNSFLAKMAHRTLWFSGDDMSFMFYSYTPYTMPWGQNLYPEDNEIHNFGRRILALHHNAFSSSDMCSFRADFFWGHFFFSPFALPRAPGGRSPEIHTFCPLFSRCIIPNLNRIERVVIKKKLKMFNCSHI